MGLNNKGMFFTLIAITLISIIAISMTIVSLSNQRDSVKKRVGNLNSIVSSVEQDLSRKVYVSSYRIIFIFEKRILENGTYISNVSKFFEEAFFSGTIDGSASLEEQQILSGVLYNDIKDELIDSVKNSNLEMTITNPSIEVKQTDPWNVLIRLNLSMYINDKGGLASWNRTGAFDTYIPVEKFDDPLYIINTNGIFVPKMKKSPYTVFNTTTLTDTLNKTYYFATNESPSFLNRLAGNFSPNTYGVESFVNLQALTNAGLSVLNKSIIDHVYFSSLNPSTKYISGMPSWFRVDTTNHTNIYGL